MRPKSLMLSGISRANRHAVISAVSGAISSVGGWIVHHEMYSNIAAMIRFSAPGDTLSAWEAEVRKAGVTLIQESLDTLDPAANALLRSDAEVMVSLNITFVHDEPDARSDIPAVPR